MQLFLKWVDLFFYHFIEFIEEIKLFNEIISILRLLIFLYSFEVKLIFFLPCTLTKMA
jgi:hypothetical protein